jgi:hypothetical protein
MVSQRKIETNRRNGRKGCGPRTATGKLRSRVNARKHGLSVSVLIDPKLQATTLQLAHAIVGSNADDRELAQALIVAEAELTLQRIRQARVTIIESAMAKTGAWRIPDTMDTSAPQPTATGAELDAFIGALPILSNIERYERRAYSRRDKAVQRLSDLQLLTRLGS